MSENEAVGSWEIGCGGWGCLLICIRPMRSTPIHPLQSLFPFLRPFREKSKIEDKTVPWRFTYRIWGPGFSPPAPFSLSGRLLGQTLDWTVTMEMSRLKIINNSVAHCCRYWREREGRRPSQPKLEHGAFQADRETANQKAEGCWLTGTAANQRAR